MKHLKLGTRGSALALTQSEWVAQRLRDAHTDLQVEIVVIKTQGDRDQNSALNKFAGKGIFTKEIEDALLAREIDLAVHSLKDLPTELPQGLMLALPPRREDPRDLLVASVPLTALPQGALVGTGSARRREQLRRLRPDLRFDEIRGNVATRVRKWREGQYDATVLACAGVARLTPESAGLQPGESHPLSVLQCVPAAGQGLLGLEHREQDSETADLLAGIADAESQFAFLAERAFLAELDGGCHIPAGALAEVAGDQLRVRAFLSQPDHPSQWVDLTGDVIQASALGREAARQLRAGSANLAPR